MHSQRRSSSSQQSQRAGSQQHQQQPTPPQREPHPAMIISHQGFDASHGGDSSAAYYANAQHQQRLAGGAYHPAMHGAKHPPPPSQQHQQQQIHAIDPQQLLGVSPQQQQQHHTHFAPVKQEVDPPLQGFEDAYLNVDYDLGAGLEMGGDPNAIMHGHHHAAGHHTAHHHPHHHADPASVLSPMSGSPTDDMDYTRGGAFSQHGSGSLSNSLHSTPYGTPGMHMPQHGAFYSVSMPVHASNGFGGMDQSKMMGSQPSSYSSAYPNQPDLEDPNLKSIDVMTEKRRRRRESHNAVERRRRDNINEKIQELATLLPDFLPTDADHLHTHHAHHHTSTPPNGGPGTSAPSASSGAATAAASSSLLNNRPNKGVILRRSVDYIRQIQHFAMLLVDRHHELDNALRSVLERTGIHEAELGLSQPLGTSVEMPLVQHVQPGGPAATAAAAGSSANAMGGVQHQGGGGSVGPHMGLPDHEEYGDMDEGGH
ncbi:hypothetical protein HDU86_002957 [Geranomyces michiganensis]|nr:hypothetical protein HDU86_002957 [Geranomyces michiganensis]